MKYRLSKMGDGWKYLPEEERKSKFEFERLLTKISKREKMLERIETDLKNYKSQLKEWKKIRTELYKKLLKYHKEFNPTFSISISKKGKIKSTNVGDFLTGGNKSWTITILISGERKSIYLGTNKDVCEFLDKFYGNTEFWTFKPEKIPHHEEKIKNSILKVVIAEIKRDMLKCIDITGSILEFWEKDVKGQEYLERILKTKKEFNSEE